MRLVRAIVKRSAVELLKKELPVLFSDERIKVEIIPDATFNTQIAIEQIIDEEFNGKTKA